MKKRIADIALLVLAAAVLAFMGAHSLRQLKAGAKDIAGFFSPKKDTIALTDNVITQIQAISELVSASYCEETVIHYFKPGSKRVLKDEDEIVFIVKGKVRAGVDFAAVTRDDISFSGDTLRLRLPSPKILDVVVNPSDVEVYEEQGSWNHTTVTMIQERAKGKLEQNALLHNILGKAADECASTLAKMFTASGFTRVDIEFTQPQLTAPGRE